MSQNKATPKIISFSNAAALKRREKPSGHRLGRQARTRVISITSGKGGVGKTNIVANLGYALSHMGQKVMILDADLGLANLDILLGLVPKYNLSHVVAGEKAVSEIVLQGPGQIQILPAASGILELTHLSKEHAAQIFTELDDCLRDVDILLLDTAAGISSNVMHFNSIAQEVLVVVSPEPTAITDAYALMKILSKKYAVYSFKLMVNMVRDIQEAQEVFRQLRLVADRFLNITIDYLGHIVTDENIVHSVKLQRIVGEMFPEARASGCFQALAKKLCMARSTNFPKDDTNFFWQHLL